MRQYCYNVFDYEHHVIRLKMIRGPHNEVLSCKFDYLMNSNLADVIAESFEIGSLVKFLPENIRNTAFDVLDHFNFQPCIDMTQEHDDLELVDDYL